MNDLFETLPFRPADILLPQNCDLGLWSVVACDQYTSQPEYWQRVEERVGRAPSSLRLILPESCLDGPSVETDIMEINNTMSRYLREERFALLPQTMIYVERTLHNGKLRRGLVGMVDLEQYDYEPGSPAQVRATEGTVLSRIPPRVAVRKNAPIELPHVMLLTDDPERTVIEPLAREKAGMEQVYDFDLMERGGHLAGWAVEDPALVEQINTALANLGDAAAFAARWPAAAGQPPMTLAVGDGNHSLATAKAYWEELKPTLPPEQQQTHPARWCLAEVCNVHSPAIEIEPIHRVLFGVDANTVAADFGSWLEQHGAALQGGDQHIVLAGAGAEITFDAANAPDPLAVGTTEHFIGDYLAQNPGVTVDYIHGAAAARAMAADPAKPATALLMPDFAKADLFKGVVLGGVLPRKTFSMGHAEEKRYYNECRSLTMPD